MAERLTKPGFIDAVKELAEKVQVPSGPPPDRPERLRGGEVDQTGVHRCGKGVGGSGSVGPPPDGPERLRVAARLTKPGFIDALMELAEHVPSDRLQTVLNDCVAARLTEPRFIPFVKSWFDLAGTSVFQGNGIYIRRLWYRREDDGVHRDAVKRLAEMVPSDRLQKVLKKCVVARLTKPGFIDTLMELAEHVPSDPPPDGPEQVRGGEVDRTGTIPFGKSWFDLVETSIFSVGRMCIRRLWYRREDDGVHRDCYSNERKDERTQSGIAVIATRLPDPVK